LLLQPAGAALARVVAIPDADWTPEAIVGMAPGVPVAAQFARRLAENGCQVIVPVLINRDCQWSGIAGVKMTTVPAMGEVVLCAAQEQVTGEHDELVNTAETGRHARRQQRLR